MKRETWMTILALGAVLIALAHTGTLSKLEWFLWSLGRNGGLVMVIAGLAIFVWVALRRDE